MQRLNVVVIGGGAAGFFAAITCARTFPQVQVSLLEAGKQPLGKVLISGGGRCNVTHACFDPAALVNFYPRGGKALRGSFTRFQAQDTVKWFEAEGVGLKTESDGRMFPVTDSSETIAQCLIDAANDAGVRLKVGVGVSDISHQDGKFQLTLRNATTLECDRLLIATGSSPQGYRWVGKFGHTLESPVPSLFTFNIADPRLQGLAGVAVETAKVKLHTEGKQKLEQLGPVLITHWGLSGPAILKLSAWGARALHDRQYQATLQINWLPQMNPEKLKETLLAVKSQLPRRAISGSCPVMIPRRLWQSLTAFVGIGEEKRWSELSNQNLNQLITELTQGEYKIQGKGAFKEEFVTCGGVSLKEVDFKTMESRIIPGLYFAGEILDIDGITGGFNFQSAWTTGYLAGLAIGAKR